MAITIERMWLVEILRLGHYLQLEWLLVQRVPADMTLRFQKSGTLEVGTWKQDLANFVPGALQSGSNPTRFESQ